MTGGRGRGFIDGQEEDAHARGDRGQAAPGRGADRARHARGRCDPLDRGDRADLLPLAAGVRRAEARPGETPEGARGRGHAPASRGLGSDPRQADPGGSGAGKLPSPARRRAGVGHVVAELGVPERLACRVLGPWQRRCQALHPAQGPDHPGRPGGPERRYHRAGPPLWPSRLPPGHRPAAGRGLAGEPHAGRAIGSGAADGGGRGSRSRPSNPRRAGPGCTTAPAPGCGRRTRTTSGPTASSRTAPMARGGRAGHPSARRPRSADPGGTGEDTACSPRSTRPPARAWPSGWTGS